MFLQNILIHSEISLVKTAQKKMAKDVKLKSAYHKFAVLCGKMQCKQLHVYTRSHFISCYRIEIYTFIKFPKLCNFKGEKLQPLVESTCDAASHWIILFISGSPPKTPHPQFPVAIPTLSCESITWELSLSLFPSTSLLFSFSEIPVLFSWLELFAYH